MGVEIYTAAGGAGKTAYLIEEVGRLGRGGLADVRVCVPTGLQARMWRRRLAAAGGALGVQVLTLDQLVGVCLHMAAGAYVELSEPVQQRLLGLICQEVGLVYYRPLMTKPGFIQVLQRRIAEFKAAGIEPAALRRVWAESSPRLAELALIYEAYQERLQLEGWADRIGLQWLATEALAADESLATDWGVLIIDGFDDFSNLHLGLWEILAGRAERMIFSLTQVPTVRYPRYERLLRRVTTATGVVAKPFPPIKREIEGVLEQLSARLFTTDLGGEVAVEVGDVVGLQAAPDRAGEVRAALRWLKRRVVEGGVGIDELALLARDITPYRSFVRQIGAEFGIPVHFLDGLPLAESPVMAAILNLLAAHLPKEEDEEGRGQLLRRQVVGAWRSPYFRWQGEGVKIEAGASVHLDVVARHYQVIGGYDEWREALVACQAAEKKEGRQAEEGGVLGLPQGEAAEMLAEQFDFFYEMTKPPARGTWRQFVAWLERLMGDDPKVADGVGGGLELVAQVRAGGVTAGADIAALRALKDILRGLVWAAATTERVSRQISFRAFFEQLQGAIQAALYHVPAPAAGVLMVGNVTQLRGVVLQGVALMGLSEGVFPASIHEDPFLRDMDRLLLNRELGLDLLPSTQSAEQAFFYEAVTRARRGLLLTRPTLADNGADWVASPFWEGVKDILGVEPERLTSHSYATLARAASAAEWWERAAAAHPLLAERTEPEGWRRVERAGQIWAGRQGGALTVWQGDLGGVGGELQERFGAEHIWSASRFESYQMCGYFFLMQHVWKLQPRSEPEMGLSPTQLGTIYHDIFEGVYQAERPSLVGEGAEAWVREVAAAVLLAAPAKLGFRVTPWWQQTEGEIVANVWESVQKLEGDSFQFLRTEAAFGMGDNPPLVIGEGEARLQLRGYIDRVDQNEVGQIRVVDYKLGGKAGFTEKAFLEGKKLQLPLYAAAAERALGLGEVVDGFYWHFKSHEASGFQLGKVEGGVAEAIERAVAYARGVQRGVREGVFVAEAPVGGCPDYCPAVGFCVGYKARRF